MTQNEDRIVLAIQAFKRGQFKHLKTTCKAYNTPYTTARKRVAGVPERRVSTSNGRKLTDLEEQALEQWILAIIGRGLSIGLQSIRVMANILLSKRGGAEVVEALVILVTGLLLLLFLRERCISLRGIVMTYHAIGLSL
jgi:hypothetical protein